VRGILVPVQVADRNCLHFPLFNQLPHGRTHRRLIERLQLIAIGIHAAGDAEPHALGHQRRAHVVFQRIHLRAVAIVAAHLEDVFEAGIGEDAGDGTLVLKHGVESERSAMDEGIEIVAIDAEAADRGVDAGGGIARRGEALLQPPFAAVDVKYDSVDEGATNIDCQTISHMCLTRRRGASHAAARSPPVVAPE
jgi:hypothetical protein